MDELKELLQKQGTAFEEFKKANDARLAEIEKKGVASADTATKVETINEELTKLGKELAEIAKKANRPRGTQDGPEETEEQREYKQAFYGWLTKGDGDAELRGLQKKAFRSGSDPDGGFFLPTEVEAGIDRLVRQAGGLAQLATTVQGDAAEYKRFVKVSGGSARWVGETSRREETGTGKFEALSYNPGKLMAEPMLFADALEDRTTHDLEAELIQEIGEAFEDVESEAFMRGDGVGKPRGLLTYPQVANSSWSWGKLGFVKTGAAGGFHATAPADALIDLVHSLPRKLRGGARFMMNDLTLASCRKLKDSEGNYLWRPGLSEGAPDRLLGYAIEIDDFMDDVGANNHPISFGDFGRGYLVYRKRGMTLRPRQYHSEYDAFLFPTVAKVGGGIRNFQAIKLLRVAA